MDLTGFYQLDYWFEELNYEYQVEEDTSIKHQRTTINNVFGDHMGNRNNEDVQGICFVIAEVQYVPHGLQNFFPNLNALVIQACGLKSLTSEDLIGLRNLKSLSITQNDLESLPSDLFVGMNKLKRIIFNKNKLKFLSSKLLKPIIGNDPDLVSFERNTAIDCLYEKGSERGTKSLEELMEIIDRTCEPPKDEIDRALRDQMMTRTGILWKSGDFSDFTITGGFDGNTKEFKVHQFVLIVMSPVFAAALTHDMEEKRTGEMKIDDFSADVVENFLHYIYTGEIQERVEFAALFSIAARYDVEALVKRVERILILTLNKSNALEIFQTGYLHNNEKLMKSALDVVKKMFPQKNNNDELMKKPEVVKMIVEGYQQIQKVHDEIDQQLQ